MTAGSVAGRARGGATAGAVRASRRALAADGLLALPAAVAFLNSLFVLPILLPWLWAVTGCPVCFLLINRSFVLSSRLVRLALGGGVGLLLLLTLLAFRRSAAVASALPPAARRWILRGTAVLAAGFLGLAIADPWPREEEVVENSLEAAGCGYPFLMAESLLDGIPGAEGAVRARLADPDPSWRLMAAALLHGPAGDDLSARRTIREVMGLFALLPGDPGEWGGGRPDFGNRLDGAMTVLAGWAFCSGYLRFPTWPASWRPGGEVWTWWEEHRADFEDP